MKPLNEDLCDLLANWDHGAFVEFCQRLEVLLLRRRLDGAIEAIKSQFFYANDAAPMAHQHLAGILPVRLANALEAGGYHTVQSVVQAKDSDLVRLKGVGDGQLRVINGLRAAFKNRTPMREFVDREGLQDEFKLDMDYLLSVENDPEKMSDEEIRKEMLRIKCRFEDLKTEMARRS